jgi:hypothetical protein
MIFITQFLKSNTNYMYMSSGGSPPPPPRKISESTPEEDEMGGREELCKQNLI